MSEPIEPTSSLLADVSSTETKIEVLEQWCTDLEATQPQRALSWLRYGESFSALGRLVHLNLERCGLSWKLLMSQPTDYEEVYMCAGATILLPVAVQDISGLSPGGTVLYQDSWGELVSKTVTYMNDRGYAWYEIAKHIRDGVIKPLQYDLAIEEKG